MHQKHHFVDKILSRRQRLPKIIQSGAEDHSLQPLPDVESKNPYTVLRNHGAASVADRRKRGKMPMNIFFKNVFWDITEAVAFVITSLKLSFKM